MHDASLTTFSGIGTILCILPIPLQWRARNSGTLLLITWLLIGNFMFFVDGIIWWDNYLNSAPIWCDIVSKLFVGLTVGISASSLCITRRLVKIASSSTVVITQRQKRLALLNDLLLGIGLPLFVMALHYTVQPHRFDIIEGYGCQTATWAGIPAIFAIYWWSLLLTTVAAVYGVIAIRLFLSRRLQFQTILKSSRSGLDNRQYIRLLALSSVDIVIGMPFTIFALVQNIRNLRPYPSWEWVHLNFGRIDHFSADQYLASAESTTTYILPRWLPPLLAIVFFLFFGVSVDAVREYSRWVDWIACKLRVRSLIHKEQLPIVIPKLGSTIVQPAETAWKGGSAEADEASREDEFTVSRRQDSSGIKEFAVAVSVERQVV